MKHGNAEKNRRPSEMPKKSIRPSCRPSNHKPNAQAGSQPPTTRGGNLSGLKPTSGTFYLGENRKFLLWVDTHLFIYFTKQVKPHYSVFSVWTLAPYRGEDNMGRPLRTRSAATHVTAVFERYLAREIGVEHDLALFTIRRRQLFTLLHSYRTHPRECSLASTRTARHGRVRRKSGFSGSSRMRRSASAGQAIQSRSTTTALCKRRWPKNTRPSCLCPPSSARPKKWILSGVSIPQGT